MSTAVEQTSVSEPAGTKMVGATDSSAAATSTPKVSLFASKSGFVIPKNKLSGSLVPIFQRNKKLSASDAAKEESLKPSPRKTKWGPDLTQDATVKRGRALALKTRVDQITQQLRLGILEFGESLDSPSSSEQLDRKSSSHVLDREKSKQLELEKREAIGEILKLDANYKAPPDYKPLLKEEKFPIPIKEFPGYNFIGLIFGPGGDNRKRLEKETGAKIQIYGIKAEKDKGEIISSDVNDLQESYEEMYVHASADTYDKVDSAISVIELLVTSISGNLATTSAPSSAAAAGEENIHDEQHTSNPLSAAPSAPQGAVESFTGSSQAASEGQFQFPGPWASVPSPASMFSPLNPSANNLLHQPLPPFNAPNMPSPFGSQSGAGGLNSQSPNQPHFLQNSFMNRLPALDIRVSPSTPFPSSVVRPPMNQGHPPMYSHPNIAPSGAILNTSMANTNPPHMNFVARPSPPNSLGGTLNSPVPHAFPSVGSLASLPSSINSNPQGMHTPHGNPLNSSLGPGPSHRSPFSPFESGMMGPNFPPMRSSSMALRQNTNFGDFTFQPHHQPQMPRFLPPNAAPPQALPFRSPPVPDYQHRHELFPRPPIPGRYPSPNMGPAMGEMTFGPPTRSPNLGPAAFPYGAGNQMEPRRNFRPSMTQADMLLPPRSQQFVGRNLPYGRPGPGAREPQQVYDPFSPTSVANMPQRQGENSGSGKRRENDPEYEDLMASVGVK